MVKVFTKESTNRSPYVNFDSITGIMELSGRSIMENSKMFYEPIVGTWFEEYIKSPAPKTVVNIILEYFNTSSSIWIFQLFRKAEDLQKLGSEVEINWHYGDDDILEAGEDYKPLTSVPFNFVEISEDEYEQPI